MKANSIFDRSKTEKWMGDQEVGGGDSSERSFFGRALVFLLSSLTIRKRWTKNITMPRTAPARSNHGVGLVDHTLAAAMQRAGELVSRKRRRHSVVIKPTSGAGRRDLPGLVDRLADPLSFGVLAGFWSLALRHGSSVQERTRDRAPAQSCDTGNQCRVRYREGGPMAASSARRPR